MAASTSTSIPVDSTTSLNKIPHFDENNFPMWKNKAMVVLESMDYLMLQVIKEGPVVPTHTVNDEHGVSDPEAKPQPKPQLTWSVEDKRQHSLDVKARAAIGNSLPYNIYHLVQNCGSAKMDFMPTRGGYFIGNVSPAKMDFRWFCLGNCVAILSSLATPEQSSAIMDLIESRWGELVGEMPLKICYPAMESHEWRIVTGCDPKNTGWSYHNGGSWPVLIWLLTAACIKAGRPQIAKRAIELAESRLLMDQWPEYYDGKLGRFVGKQARKNQTWSIAGYLVAKMMLEDPSHLGMISLEEDKQMKPQMKRSASWVC